MAKKATKPKPPPTPKRSDPLEVEIVKEHVTNTHHYHVGKVLMLPLAEADELIALGVAK